MKVLVVLMALVVTPLARAGFLFHYGINYSSDSDSSEDGKFENKKLFHKLYLGASVNQLRTLYFGWNINSWNSSTKKGDDPEDTYSILEMGPKMVWYLNENYNWYFGVEWSPYARGDRKKSGTDREISGSSYGVGLGYRFKISKAFGFGASVNYHSFGISEEKIETNEEEISEKVSQIMPMLELSIITR